MTWHRPQEPLPGREWRPGKEWRPGLKEPLWGNRWRPQSARGQQRRPGGIVESDGGGQEDCAVLGAKGRPPGRRMVCPGHFATEEHRKAQFCQDSGLISRLEARSAATPFRAGVRGIGQAKLRQHRAPFLRKSISSVGGRSSREATSQELQLAAQD